MPARPLRPWQAEAAARYSDEQPEDYLVTATPGAGKTTFGLHLGQELLRTRRAGSIIVVTPTDHLRRQWADAAAELGLRLDPTLSNAAGSARQGFDGYVATYAQVAARPTLHRRRSETGRAVVLLDEIHHCADGQGSSWGEAVREAFESARRRIALTGTPFRTRPDERIPFVTYRDVDTDTVESVADYEYGYRRALQDGVVRPVVFAAYTGVARWLDSAGEAMSAELGTGSKKDETAAWRTALDPKGQWIPHVIAAADGRLSDMRESSMPDAAGLLLASSQETARAYARIVKRVTGRPATLVLSDDRRSDRKLQEFGSGDGRWVVAVQMISEGVDIPRLGVLVWATAYRTPLFFAQAVGRVVRARKAEETAAVFLPAVRPLLALAADLESRRNQVVARATTAPDELDETMVRERTEGGGPTLTALEADAEFAHLLHDGRAILPGETELPTGDRSPDDDDFLGLPGLLTPEQTAALLAARDGRARLAATATLPEEPTRSAVADDWRDVRRLRRMLNGLVSQRAGRTGESHGAVHAAVRRAVPGPPSSAAGHELLTRRCDHLEQLLA